MKLRFVPGFARVKTNANGRAAGLAHTYQQGDPENLQILSLLYLLIYPNYQAVCN